MQELKRILLITCCAALATTLLFSFQAPVQDAASNIPAVGLPGGPRTVLTGQQLSQFRRGRDLFDKNFRIGTNTLLVMVAAGMIFIVALLADLVVQVTRPKHTVLPAAVVEVSPPRDQRPLSG